MLGDIAVCEMFWNINDGNAKLNIFGTQYNKTISKHETV